MKKRNFAIGIISLLGVQQSHADLFFDPISTAAPGKFQASVSFGKNKGEYDSKSATISGSLGSTTTADEKLTIERQYFAANASYGVSDKIDVVGIFGQSTKAELDFDTTADPNGDKGTVFGVGARGKIPVSNFVLNAYAQYVIMNDEFGSLTDSGVKYSISAKTSELSAGALASKDMGNSFTVFGGVEFIPMSNIEGEINASATGGTASGKPKLEREGSFGFHVGGLYNLGQFFVLGRLTFMHEQNFFVGAGMDF